MLNFKIIYGTVIINFCLTSIMQANNFTSVNNIWNSFSNEQKENILSSILSNPNSPYKRDQDINHGSHWSEYGTILSFDDLLYWAAQSGLSTDEQNELKDLLSSTILAGAGGSRGGRKKIRTKRRRNHRKRRTHRRM